jgi:hypothetical protein
MQPHKGEQPPGAGTRAYGGTEQGPVEQRSCTGGEPAREGDRGRVEQKDADKHPGLGVEATFSNADS